MTHVYKCTCHLHVQNPLLQKSDSFKWYNVLALSYLRSLPEKTPQLEMCALQWNYTNSMSQLCMITKKCLGKKNHSMDPHSGPLMDPSKDYISKLNLYNMCATYHRFLGIIVSFDSPFSWKEGVLLLTTNLQDFV